MRPVMIAVLFGALSQPALGDEARETLCRDMAQLAGQSVQLRVSGNSMARVERQLLRSIEGKPASYQTVAPSVIQWAYRLQSTDAQDVANTFFSSCLKG